MIIGFLIWLWFGTGYKVHDGYIKIYFGPFRSKIKIEEIKKLSRARSPFTAPALSTDRIEILYGNYDVIHLSPKHEKQFINKLLAGNPTIAIEKDAFNHHMN